MTTPVGILGIGIHLPSVVRKNDYWPAHIVEKWQRRPAGTAEPMPELTDGMAKVAAAMAALAGDPFQGAVERRVMPDGMESSEMEILASREALARAGVEPAEIDLLLVFSFCPDQLNTPNACVIHQALGLPQSCLTMGTDSVCNSFQMQMTLAEAMIASGQARRALLVQSSALSRVTPYDQPFSAWFGDGATAVVVGPVSPGKGILGRAHRTDGTLHKALACGVPGKHWYDDGRVIAYNPDKNQARRMLLTLADSGREIVGAALHDAGASASQVDFYASHQATLWFRRVTQEHIGLSQARAVDTFPWAGSLSAANLPLVMAIGEREGLLRDGDLVASYAGGTGITYSSLVLRWGR